jgi:hypothetical protein
VCDWSVEVRLDNTPPYQAQVRQSVQLAWVPQFVPARTLADQPQHVVIDWDAALAEAAR